MDEKSKEAQRNRYLRAARKMIGHEEQKHRKSNSASRRAQRSQSRRPSRDWDADSWEDGDDQTFEKIQRSQPTKRTGGTQRSAEELAALPTAIVTAVHQGRVVLDNGATARVAGHLLVDTSFRLVVGDVVRFETPSGQTRIAARDPRRSCLSRPDPGNPHHALVIAANVDLAVIVVAAKDPPLRPGLIDRLALAIEHGGATPAVCVNKFDLCNQDERAEVQATVAPYRDLGCEVFCCSAQTGEGCDELRDFITGKGSVFVGHSGVGKSSLLNALDPHGDRITGDVRQHDGRGRHTTTASSLRDLPDGTRVIDTAGVRSFGLDGLSPEQVRDGFAEFARFAAGCRFSDCTHVHEPECGVREATDNGSLTLARYQSYCRILAAQEDSD